MPSDLDRPAPGLPALVFDEVFVAHAGFAARVLAHLGVTAADLEDQCQEVFVIVHRRLLDFEGRASVRRWIGGICARVAANYRRGRGRAAAHRGELVSEPAVPGEQEREIARESARARLLELLGGLDDDRRAIFVLYELEQLSMREVAEIVGCPLQTAYSRHKAARARLLEAAQALGLQPGDTNHE